MGGPVEDAKARESANQFSKDFVEKIRTSFGGAFEKIPDIESEEASSEIMGIAFRESGESRIGFLQQFGKYKAQRKCLMKVIADRVYGDFLAFGENQICLDIAVYSRLTKIADSTKELNLEFQIFCGAGESRNKLLQDTQIQGMQPLAFAMRTIIRSERAKMLPDDFKKNFERCFNFLITRVGESPLEGLDAVFGLVSGVQRLIREVIPVNPTAGNNHTRDEALTIFEYMFKSIELWLRYADTTFADAKLAQPLMTLAGKLDSVESAANVEVGFQSFCEEVERLRAEERTFSDQVTLSDKSEAIFPPVKDGLEERAAGISLDN